MFNKTLAELSTALVEKAISSRELTELFLDRIESNKGLNAFITVTREHALAAADAADQSIAAGKSGPLTGIPIAHKDLFCTEGVRTSCGSRMLDNFISPYDATVVARFALRQGRVCLQSRKESEEHTSRNHSTKCGSV